MHFAGIIAQQTNPFTGTSLFSVKVAAPDFPNFKALRVGRYLCNVTGGVSGVFGVLVLANVSGLTFTIAGNTSVATGVNVLYPISWGTNGVSNTMESSIVASTIQLTDFIPPSYVAFQGNSATAAVSATITVTGFLAGPA